MSDTAEAPKKTTVTVRIDGREVEAKPGQLVIDAAEDAGTFVPRFCYHPRMSPVGMCRQCIVEVVGPRGPQLVVSCMTPVNEGMVVNTATPTVKKAQEGVLEFLLANHPLDCPVCDKGGECPLQDQAYSHGPGESRFVEEKRHYEKPIPISDLVYLDRERCILCDRCTRFAREVAGDPLIHFVQRGNNTQVLTFPDEPFSSYFSGNTVQICPVGALTSKPYRFKARPWDLDERESTCTMCSVGCRIEVHSSRNEVIRYQGVDVDAVNWGWLCDKGRFSYEHLNNGDRLGGPLAKQGDALVPVPWAAALDAAASAIAAAVRSGGAAGVGVIGGARGTNEDAYAWAKLAKGVIGTDNVDCQLGDGLPAHAVYGLPRATIDEAAAAPTVVLIGPDLKEELPVLFLRLRDAAEKRRTRIIELSPTATGLSPYAFVSLRTRPGEQAAAVRAVLGNGSAAAVGIADDDAARAREQLATGPVVVVYGRSSLAESADYTLDALHLLRQGVPGATFLPALRRGNVHGALDMGLAPGLLPGRVTLDQGREHVAASWPQVPATHGLDTRGMLEAAAAGRLGCLVLLGADPLSDFPDKDLAQRALAGAGAVVAIDSFLNASSRKADVVLAAAMPAEKSGTTTNLEGRVSAINQKVTPVGTARPDWIIAAELALRLEADLGFETTAQVWAEITAVAPSHRDLPSAAAASTDGVLAGPSSVPFLPVEAPELPRADGYGLRLVASRKLYDAGVGVAKSPAMASLAPGARLHLNPYDLQPLGVPTGTPVRVTTTRTALVLDAVADVGVPRGSAWVAFNQPNVAVAELISSSDPVTTVRIETVR